MTVPTMESKHRDSTTTRTPNLKRAPVSRRRSSIIWYTFAATLAVLIATPVLLFFARLFEDGGSTFARLSAMPGIGTTFLTTVLLAAGSTAIGAIIAVALAAAALRVPPAMKSFAAIIPQIPLVIPAVAYVYGWIFIFDPDVGYANTMLRQLPFFSHLQDGPINIYTIPALILFTGIETSGMIFAFVYPRLLEINGSVEAAARVAGASAFRSFMTISFPLLRPGLIAGIVVAFLIGMGQFTAPLFLGTREGIKVISTEIFRLREQFPIDYPLTAALGLPLLIFGVLAILVQRHIVGDQRRYTTQSSGRGITRKPSRGAAAVIVGYAVIIIGLPLIALTLVAFSPFWNGDLANLTFTLDNVNAALKDPDVGKSIYSSVVTSFLAALIVVPLGFIAALALSGVVKAPPVVVKSLDFIFISPLAVPRALLGMVVLFVFIRPPFSLYGTLALFVIAYVFIALPFAMRSQYSSLIGVDKALFEAARVGGASQLRMVATIALPVARRGIAASIALAFVMLTHDFAVSVMVQSPGQQVMGTLLYQFGQEGAAPAIAVMSLIMTLVTAGILALTIRIAGKSALEGI
ncbi:ABC transporter permease subunit [Pseudarthrobacter oxydans]|jgi:iron(III) transport system permease protein|uniref:ABC transporter permease n=1 Tax=Pseudarthrobacter oxydans TaxID=1671 RepID=UPI002AA85AE8|nr:ABC transporter permease subunit [Pseudarthrobacter oxydans]WPU09491.1 ABC transporter permease subunit [Pseudarthrobacter oxydans]